MRLEVFKRTNEDWYPSYTINKDKLVKVICTTLHPSNKTRVAVWGADDFGLERDYDCETQALGVFDMIVTLQSVTKDHLTNVFGFHHV